MSPCDPWTFPLLRADLPAINAGFGIQIGSHVDLVGPKFLGRIRLTNETVHHRHYTRVFRACTSGKLSKRGVRIARIRKALYLRRKQVIDAAADGCGHSPCYPDMRCFRHPFRMREVEKVWHREL